jgi:hypothetical protein
MVAPVILALEQQKLEDQELENSLGYIVSARPAWDT